jgi:hypothetical protein
MLGHHQCPAAGPATQRLRALESSLLSRMLLLQITDLRTEANCKRTPNSAH